MATEIAKAYVQIVPSMQGIQAQLSKSLAPAVETSGKESGQKMGNALAGGLKSAASSIGKAFTAAAKAAAVGFGAAAAAAVGKSALNAYADYEQLVGGVETLFGNASDKVLQNANRAFQTAGLSANEYMETVTSFSASLLQSVGKDTKKAAEYADQALVDMSDNANKMGSNMQDIQNPHCTNRNGNHRHDGKGSQYNHSGLCRHDESIVEKPARRRCGRYTGLRRADG